MTAIFLAVARQVHGVHTEAPLWLRWSPSVPARPWLVIRHGHSKVSYILEARPGFGIAQPSEDVVSGPEDCGFFPNGAFEHCLSHIPSIYTDT